jgi:hypothetical protein
METQHITLKEVHCANPACNCTFKVQASSTKSEFFHSTDCELAIYPDRRKNYIRREHSAVVQQQPKPHAQRPKIEITDGQTKEQQADIEDRWQKYVLAGQRLVASMQKDRLKLAELAIAACDIQHGGSKNRLSEIYTLKKYAEDIKISYKTLANWVRIKQNVFDKLKSDGVDPDPIKDWSMMNRISERSPKETPKEVITENFKKLTAAPLKGQPVNPHHYFMQGLRRLRSTAYFVKKHKPEPSMFKDEDIKEMVEHCKTLIGWAEKK